jgi:excisionase family DNA binding protein
MSAEVTFAGRASGSEPEFYRVREICRRLALSRTAVYGLMDRGELEYVKFGRSRRVPRAAVEGLIRKQTVPAR